MIWILRVWKALSVHLHHVISSRVVTINHPIGSLLVGSQLAVDWILRSHLLQHEVTNIKRTEPDIKIKKCLSYFFSHILRKSSLVKLVTPQIHIYLLPMHYFTKPFSFTLNKASTTL